MKFLLISLLAFFVISSCQNNANAPETDGQPESKVWVFEGSVYLSYPAATPEEVSFPDLPISFEELFETADLVAQSAQLPESKPGKEAAVFRVLPFIRAFDRVYPGLIKINSNHFVINLDYYFPANEQRRLLRTQFSYDPAERACRTNHVFDRASFEEPDKAIGRYVSIFSSVDTCLAFANSIKSNGEYTEGSSFTFGRVEQIWRHYVELFGEHETSPPILMIADVSVDGSNPQGPGWQADVGWNDLVFVRIYDKNTRGELLSSSQFFRLISHEIVHLWIGKRFRLNEPETAANLIHEGAAEYLSLLHSAENMDDSSERLEFLARQLSQHVNACLDSLPFSGFLGADMPQTGRAPYDCGVLVAFFSDVELRNLSNGEQNYATNWGVLFARRLSDNRVDYSLSEWLGASGDHALPLSSELLYASQIDADLVSTLFSGIGIKMSEFDRTITATEALNRWLARSLLSHQCPEAQSLGFWTDKQNRVLTIDALGCDRSLHLVEIDSINGVNLFEDATGGFEAYVTGCRNSGYTQLGLGSEVVGRFSCPAVMPSLPKRYEITEIPDLAF